MDSNTTRRGTIAGRSLGLVGGLLGAVLGMVALAQPAAADSIGTDGNTVVWTQTSTGVLAQDIDGSGTVISQVTTNQIPGTNQIVGATTDSVFGVNDKLGSSISYNPTTGEVRPIGFGPSGVMIGPDSLDWRCPTDCAAEFKLIGYADVNLDQNPDVIWFDTKTSQVAAWLTSQATHTIGSGTYLTVTGTMTLQSGCDLACGDTKAVAAGYFTDDRVADVLTYNANTGVVRVVQFDSHGHIAGTRTVSWGCGPRCDWDIVGLADSNHDGRLDVVWNDRFTGDVATWRLDGFGGVLGAQTLHTETQAFAHILGTSLSFEPVIK